MVPRRIIVCGTVWKTPITKKTMAPKTIFRVAFAASRCFVTELIPKAEASTDMAISMYNHDTSYTVCSQTLQIHTPMIDNTQTHRKSIRFFAWSGAPASAASLPLPRDSSRSSPEFWESCHIPSFFFLRVVAKAINWPSRWAIKTVPNAYPEDNEKPRRTLKAKVTDPHKKVSHTDKSTI